MKVITPMKRFSSNLTELKNILDKDFKVIELNKSSPKYNRYADSWTKMGEKRGVDSDYILIFQEKNTKISFAFVFTFLNLLPQDHYVLGSIKPQGTNISIENSLPMSLNDFNNNLKKFISFLNTNNQILPAQVLNEFSNIFLEFKIDLDAEVKKIEENVELIKKQIKDETNWQEKVINRDKKEKELKKILRSIDEEINDSEDQKELKKLTLRMKELQKIISNKKDELLSKNKVAKKEKELIIANQEIRKIEASISMKVEESFKKENPFAVKRLKNKIK